MKEPARSNETGGEHITGRSVSNMPHHQGPYDRLFYEFHRPQDIESVSVTFLHGLGSCGEDWILQLPSVDVDYAVLTVDLPGHGGSSLRGIWPRISNFADDVADLIQALGLGPTHVVGLSLGGLVAQELALDHPDLVRSLVLVNTFPKLHLWKMRGFRAHRRLPILLRGDMDALGGWLVRELFPGDGMEEVRELAVTRIKSNARSAYVRNIMALLRFDVSKRLGDIAAPTLVVSGERDLMVPHELKESLVFGIPTAKIEIVNDSGHATPIDSPDIFNNMLLRFLHEVDEVHV
jgi:pimeloyl-ACP methyl ester carboxylesterase